MLAGQHYGPEASPFLKNLLRGESVYIVYGEERTDKFGRTLAYLYRAPDGLFVNAEIVRQGYGRAYVKYPFEYTESFRELEGRAINAGKGMWSHNWVPSSSTPEGTPALEVPAKFQEASITVYPTKTGTKYHLGHCRYLRKSKIPVTLEDAKGRASACKVCKPPE